MKVVYDSALKANLSLDETGRVRSIRQSEPYQPAEGADAVDTAIAYLRQASGAMETRDIDLANAREQVSFFAPEDKGAEYRLSEVKEGFGATTVGFYQTYLNLPVWQAGIAVSVKQGPNRVTGALNTSQTGIDAALPSPEKVERFRTLLGPEPRLPPAEQAEAGAAFVRSLIARPPDSPAVYDDQARLIRGRLFIYRYAADQRLPQPAAVAETPAAAPVEAVLQPVLPLPPVPPEIQDGHYYAVAEVTFSYATAEYGLLNWQALVELETEAVLYLRALIVAVQGRVFKRDPITTSGDATRTANLSNAELNVFRTWEMLPRLVPPSAGGAQALTGDFVAVCDFQAPVVAPPLAPAATGFDFDVRTNEFAAVNAYYHPDEFFAELEALGFDRATYFDGTTFPLRIDHRGLGTDCDTINAACGGNGAGGIAYVVYALNDTTDVAHPVGRACDSRVIWHELGGHGVLFDHINRGSFQFCHSAGDALSAIRHDPDSHAPDRGRYAPWNPINLRRIDRELADGWGWGGPHDDRNYGTEEIMSSTLFRAYRAIGGDSPDLSRRQFASRMMQWLILQTIGKFTEAANPLNAQEFAEAMIWADEDNWTIGGADGPCYGKVVRWAFEKQGLYNAQPADVDVYIDDGRHGEYTYLNISWENPAIWNRRHADSGTAHEQAVPGVVNYAYVKIKNRGLRKAQNVRVRGYHCRPLAGVLWPHDLQPMTTAELTAGTLAPHNGEEKIVGPFAWTPNNNMWGHDCILMVVTADGDDSNIGRLAAGEVVPDWRLVPNDNNIGQRNVVLATITNPQALGDWLDGLTFYVANPKATPARLRVQVELPSFLATRGWRLRPDGQPRLGFELGPKEQRAVTLHVQRGLNIDATLFRRTWARNVRVKAYAGGLPIGGITYRLDPGPAFP